MLDFFDVSNRSPTTVYTFTEPSPLQNLFRALHSLSASSFPIHQTLASSYRSTSESLMAHIVMPLTSINSDMIVAASEESKSEVENGSYVSSLFPYNPLPYMQISLKHRLRVITFIGAQYPIGAWSRLALLRVQLLQGADRCSKTRSASPIAVSTHAVIDSQRPLSEFRSTSSEKEEKYTQYV